MHYATIIIGGGPAGCAAAICLARSGQSVALLERSRYENQRIGELLPPKARVQLQRLGAQGVCQGHVPSPGIVSHWGNSVPYEQDFILNAYGNGWNLDRRRFDAALAELADWAGADVFPASRVSSISRGERERWRLESAQGGSTRFLSANFLIDATGRARFLARQMGARPVLADRLVAVLSTFALPMDWSGDQRMWLEAAENGWWYTAPLPDHRLLVAYITDTDLLPPQARTSDFVKPYFRQAIQSRLGLPDGIEPTACTLVSAASYCLDQIAGDGWAAAGDAAMSWDPLSGTGITKALESGIRIADAVLEFAKFGASALTRYADWTLQQFSMYQQTVLRYYTAEKRWSASPFWQRRQQEFLQ